jgi:hypothetical protein
LVDTDLDEVVGCLYGGQVDFGRRPAGLEEGYELRESLVADCYPGHEDFTRCRNRIEGRLHMVTNHLFRPSSSPPRFLSSSCPGRESAGMNAAALSALMRRLEQLSIGMARETQIVTKSDTLL